MSSDSNIPSLISSLSSLSGLVRWCPFIGLEFRFPEQCRVDPLASRFTYDDRIHVHVLDYKQPKVIVASSVPMAEEAI